MSRTAVAADRVVLALLGLVSLLAGIALVLWSADLLGSTPRRADLRDWAAVGDQGWWPWLLAVAGLLLGLLALRWLWAHLPARPPSRMSMAPLPGPDGDEAAGTPTARVNLAAVADAWATDAQCKPGIAAARGRVAEQEGQPFLDLVATVAPDVELSTAHDAVMESLGSLTSTTQGRIPARVRLRG